MSKQFKYLTLLVVLFLAAGSILINGAQAQTTETDRLEKLGEKTLETTNDYKKALKYYTEALNKCKDHNPKKRSLGKKAEMLLLKVLFIKHGFSSDLSIGYMDVSGTWNVPWVFTGLPTDEYSFTEHKHLEEGFIKRMEALYEELKNRKFHHIERMAQEIADQIERYFSALEVYRELRRKAEKEAIEERKSAPQQIAAEYKDEPRPKNLEEIKKLILLLPEWKVKVVNVYDRNTNRKIWVEPLFSFGDTEMPEAHIIFGRPPLDASPYKERFILVKAEVSRKYGKMGFILTDSDGKEAIAAIPKKVLQTTALSFGESGYMVCKLLGVHDVNTVSGTTKSTSVVRVEGIITTNDYYAFKKYVLGHPNEFPQKKFVTTKF